MAVQQIQSIDPTIPDVLKPFYTGVEAKGGQPAVPGLIERGMGAIYPGGLSGQAAYQAQYSPVIQAGLMGAGSIAGLSPYQQQVGQTLGSMQLPGQYGLGMEAGQQSAAGLQALQNYQALGVAAPNLSNYQLNAPADVSTSNFSYFQAASPYEVNAPTLQNYDIAAPSEVNAPTLQNYDIAAPSAVNAPNLSTYQMAGPSQFTSDIAQQYMSPYISGVVGRQQEAAIKAAREAQLGQNLAAARQGTYGGARQALLQNAREATLQTQLNDIQQRGLQSAYEQAQSQFERDRAAQMGIGAQNLQAALGVQQLGAGQNLQAQLANQAAQQAAAQANLQSRLGVQQLGAGQNLQAQLANQAAQQAAAQANLQSRLGVQQLGAGQNLQAQLANQAAQQAGAQANLQAAIGVQQQETGQELQAKLANQAAQQATQQANLQSLLGVQQLGSGQSLQAQLANQAAQQQAAQTRLAAAQGLGGLAGTFGQLGTQQLAGQLDLLKTQGAYGDLQRNIEQQRMDAQRQMLMDQAQYGQTQVGQLSNLLRGIPTTAATQTTTSPPPSFASQLTGLGLTGIGLYNMLGGGVK